MIYTDNHGSGTKGMLWNCVCAKYNHRPKLWKHLPDFPSPIAENRKNTQLEELSPEEK